MARDRDLTWAREQRERDAAILRAYVDSMIDDQRGKRLVRVRETRAQVSAWALIGLCLGALALAALAEALGCA